MNNFKARFFKILLRSDHSEHSGTGKSPDEVSVHHHKQGDSLVMGALGVFFSSFHTPRKKKKRYFSLKIAKE